MSKIVLSGLAALSLTACTTSGPASPDTFCLIAKPIYFGPSDRLSERTTRAIVSHNEKGAALCNWR